MGNDNFFCEKTAKTAFTVTALVASAVIVFMIYRFFRVENCRFYTEFFGSTETAGTVSLIFALGIPAVFIGSVLVDPGRDVMIARNLVLVAAILIQVGGASVLPIHEVFKPEPDPVYSLRLKSLEEKLEGLRGEQAAWGSKNPQNQKRLNSEIANVIDDIALLKPKETVKSLSVETLGFALAAGGIRLTLEGLAFLFMHFIAIRLREFKLADNKRVGIFSDLKSRIDKPIGIPEEPVGILPGVEKIEIKPVGIPERPFTDTGNNFSSLAEGVSGESPDEKPMDIVKKIYPDAFCKKNGKGRVVYSDKETMAELGYAASNKAAWETAALKLGGLN